MLSEMINEYKSYLSSKGLSAKTIATFKKANEYLSQYLGSDESAYLKLKIEDAQEFQSYLIEDKKLLESTVHGHISGLKGFFKYLTNNHHIFQNPFEYIEPVRVEKRVPRYLMKENDLIVFLNKLSRFDEEKNLKNAKMRYKAHLISELLYSTGLRISELSLVSLDDIDFNRGMLRAVDIKRKKKRYVFLNEYTLNLLKLYITNLREHFTEGYSRTKDNETLFNVSQGWFEKWFNSSIKKIIKNMPDCKVRNWTSHNYRHSVGYHFLRRGCDIRYIQEILGHARIGSTQIYTKVDKNDLKNILDKYHPRTFKKGKEGLKK